MYYCLSSSNGEGLPRRVVEYEIWECVSIEGYGICWLEVGSDKLTDLLFPILDLGGSPPASSLLTPYSP